MFARLLPLLLLPALAFSLSTEIVLLNQSATTVPPGGRIDFTITLKNTGGETWTPTPYAALDNSRPAGQVIHNFLPHLTDPLAISPTYIGTFHLHLSLFQPSRADYLSNYSITFLPLPQTVAPGQTLTVSDYVYAPMQPGSYRAAIKMSLVGCCNFVFRVLNSPYEDYTLSTPLEFTVVADSAGPATTSLTLAPSPAAVNTPVGLTATIDDTATGGSPVASASAAVTGPGMPGTPLPLSGAFGTSPVVNASATLAGFAEAGLFNVCVHGVDSYANAGAESCTILPVYDPSGGFVTGGGAVDSPAGADLTNPAQTGPAQFAFVSKYHKNSVTPSGNLEFQFKAGSLQFKSTAMDWLVVTGEPRAIFRGEGLLNSTTACKFEVDAWDGSGPGGGDAFGIKIFSCAGGGDRYRIEAAPITRGSIIIHRQ